MPRPNIIPKLDPAKLHFPSDAITFGQMRRFDANLFTREGVDVDGPASSDVFAVYRMELKLAEKAFAAALGRPDPHPNQDEHREVLVEDLEEAYGDYGLSPGAKASQELIQRFEAEARAQAEQFRGVPR